MGPRRTNDKSAAWPVMNDPIPMHLCVNKSSLSSLMQRKQRLRFEEFLETFHMHDLEAIYTLCFIQNYLIA